MKNNNFLKNVKDFKITNKLRFWLIPPIVILVIAFIVILSISVVNGSAADGFNIGIDFEGGTLLSVTLGEEAHSTNPNYDKHVSQITKAIESHGVTVSYVQTSSGSTTATDALQFRYTNSSDDADVIFDTNEKIVASVRALYPDLGESDIAYDTIGKTAANDLLEKAAIALVVTLVLILIYIIIRFEPVSGIVAALLTIHDAIIMFCLTVMFRIQINSSYVAAAITIIAYSINNTIVIFDRCRETMKPFKKAKSINYNEIGDEAVKTTMTRSLYTTFTTLVTVAMLAIFGSVTMREFVVPIIIGLFVGFYSSVFLATPIWAKLSYAMDGLRLKRLAKKAAEEGNKEVVIYDKKPSKEEKGDNAEGTQAEKKAKKKPQQNVWVNPKKKNTQFKKKK